MYGCESWTVKKPDCRRIDAFELRCWRRLLRVPWTARRPSQSILKISPGVHWKDWCWSWNSNTLATWCEELTHLKKPWCWEILRARGEGDNRGWENEMTEASPTQWIWVWVNSKSWWWTGKPGMVWFMGSQRVGLDWVTELNWNEIVPYSRVLYIFEIYIFQMSSVLINFFFLLWLKSDSVKHTILTIFKCTVQWY